MLSKEWQIKNFDTVANMSAIWQMCADELLISSQILYAKFSSVDVNDIKVGNVIPPEGRTFRIIKMLRAMALECLFKALWIKSGEILAINGKYKKISGTNDHNLVSLADKVLSKFAIKINGEERDILKRLSLDVTGGRYPIHKSWEATMIQSLFGGGKGPPTYWISGKDEKLFSVIVVKLTRLLENK